jgi:hypothetical protein
MPDPAHATGFSSGCQNWPAQVAGHIPHAMPRPGQALRRSQRLVLAQMHAATGPVPAVPVAADRIMTDHP